MTLSIQPIQAVSPFESVPAFISSLQEKTGQAFVKIKDSLILQSQNAAPPQQIFNLRGLLDKPGEIVEGSIWGAFWAISAYFAVDSVYKLYTTFTVEHAAQEKFEKIGSAVKNAFVDVMSLASSTTYVARWADGAEVISLGQYLPLVKNLCFGTSLVINGVETGADIYNIWVEKEAILHEGSAEKKEKHKQWLCHALMKLIGNVSMVAWASLGIATLAGLAVSSILMTALLTVGFVVGGAAIFYKMHIDESSKAGATTVPAATSTSN